MIVTLLRILWYAKWIAPVAVQLAIVGVIIYRKLVREYPAFLAYVAFDVLYSVVRFSISLLPDNYYSWYFYTSWVGNLVQVVLAFAVVREVFVHVFRSYDALQELGNLLFRWALAILLLLAVLSTAANPGGESSRLVSEFMLLQRGLSVMQCGLLFFLFLFSSYFGMSWKDSIFGIAMGFGLKGILDLVSAALRLQMGQRFDTAYSVLLPVAYNCAVLIWVAYFLRSESARRLVGMRPSPELTEWNYELSRLLHQ